MADQSYIDQTVRQLSEKFNILQREAISIILGIVEGKTINESLQIINQLNMDVVMKSKSAGIVSAYTAANRNILLGKELFAPITETSLQVLILQSEQYLTGEIVGMANAIKQEIISGIMNNRTIDQIVEAVGRRGYSPTVGMKRIVNDGLNNYSRAVTRLMMEEAPKNTKYIYIGPADEKTRGFCLSAIQLGAVTLKQIKSMGDEYAESLTSGGGVNCRHSWEARSENVRDQFYRKEEAEEILNA